MSTIETGGPAFPQPDHSAAVNPEGMTLRDYFAAAALTGMLAYSGADAPAFSNDHDREMFVKSTYRIADAMLQARKENP